MALNGSTSLTKLQNETEIVYRLYCVLRRVKIRSESVFFGISCREHYTSDAYMKHELMQIVFLAEEESMGVYPYIAVTDFKALIISFIFCSFPLDGMVNVCRQVLEFGWP